MKAEHRLDGNTRGKREMHQLAVSAFTALEDADLTDVLDQLHSRVFRRSPAELMEVELVDAVWQWRFKPMVELMLRHIADTASDSKLPVNDRRTDVRDVLELLGF